MRRPVIALVLASLVGLSGQAEAVIGTLDDVPAATLLLPYFEVDPDGFSGVTTLFTIRNVEAAPVVAHVTVWSNLSVAVLTFDVYLTGYDQQTVNLSDALVIGILPRTGPSDLLSPRGSLSEPHSTFGGTCSANPGSPPAYNIPALSSLLLTHLRTSLTGGSSPLFGQCAGAPTADGHLVGYITIDATNRCTLLFPSAVGYFGAGGTGDASNRNVLSGDWLLVHPATGATQADNLVHIEASATDPLTSTPGSYTFYGRYVAGTAADNRERLTARWNAPLDPLLEAGGTAELLVWRDSGFAVSWFSCSSLSAVFPLSATGISVLDASGTATSLALDLFPHETQRVAVAQAGSSLRADLDTANGSPFDPAKQAHVTVLRRGASALFSTGLEAVQETGAIGTLDAAPAATLLLPYFEVHPASPTGVRTALSVHNGSAAPVLARVILWTDLSVPTLGFHLYLPAFGSRVVDLKEILATGVLPASSPAPLPNCAGQLPPPALSAQSLASLVAAHTGQPSQLFGGLCSATDYGDGLARGYLTVDVMSQCTTAFPGQAGYFGGGGAVGFANVLWGDYALIDPAQNQAHGDALVHLQASTTNPLSGFGHRTFYGRYVAEKATDHREALSADWGTSSRRAGAFSGGARLVVWRDDGHLNSPFTCGTLPIVFPMTQGRMLHFDEQGQDHPLPAFALPWETQKRPVDWTGPDFGWLSLSLGRQAHVTSVESAQGLFAISIPAVQLPLPAHIFTGGFESGTFIEWAFKVP